MLTPEQVTQLREGAEIWGLRLDDPTLERFSMFAAMLHEANQQMNLTRVAPEDIVPLHFLDSLSLAAVLAPRRGRRLIDVGTGAGFPGLPLALAYPELRVTLMDSTRKRLHFLDNVIQTLRLENVRTLHARAEEAAREQAHRAAYDLVTARAVSKLPMLAAWLLPLAKPGGLAIAYKSRDVNEELDEARPAITKAGGILQRVEEVAIPFTDIRRNLILIEKQSATPKPRTRRHLF